MVLETLPAEDTSQSHTVCFFIVVYLQPTAHKMQSTGFSFLAFSPVCVFECNVYLCLITITVNCSNVQDSSGVPRGAVCSNTNYQIALVGAAEVAPQWDFVDD